MEGNEKIEVTEDTFNMMRKYASLKSEVIEIEQKVIEFLKARKATKEDPHSENWDANVWEDFWIEDDIVKSRTYSENDEGEKLFWDDLED